MKEKGFTLIELVVVVTLMGILSIVLLQFITKPVEAYAKNAKRARLVNIAETALQRMTFELRNALPNSTRVACSNRCVEYLHMVGGGVYRKLITDSSATPPQDELSFIPFMPTPPGPDEKFDVLNPILDPGLATSTSSTACRNNTAACVAIFNTGEFGGNAWQYDNIATLKDTTTVIIDGERYISQVEFDSDSLVSSGYAFPQESLLEQRFYLLDGPKSFICDMTNNALRYYEKYPIYTSQPTSPSGLASAGANTGILADRLTECDFQYEPSTTTKKAVLTVRLTITEDSEKVSLVEQIYINNKP